MKAKELMVNDWVLYGKKKHQCRNICGHNNNVLLDNGVFTNVYLLKPFPLTKVHLTKNGFEATNESDTEFVYNDGYEVRVEFDEGMPIANIEPCIFLRIDFADKELAMPIKYLHELQQAMRLFGIDKELKL